MIKFDVQQQVFYDTVFSYGFELPKDLINIPEELHYSLVEAINQKRYVDSNLIISEPKPSEYHTWVDGKWEDTRTKEQIFEDTINSLKPLSQKQFRLGFLKIGINSDKIKEAINSTSKAEEYNIILEYSDKFEYKSDFITETLKELQVDTDTIITMWKEAQTM